MVGKAREDGLNTASSAFGSFYISNKPFRDFSGRVKALDVIFKGAIFRLSHAVGSVERPG